MPGTLSGTNSTGSLGRNKKVKSHVFKQRVVEAESVLVVVFMCVFAARLAELVMIAIRAAAGTVDSARTRGITTWTLQYIL